MRSTAIVLFAAGCAVLVGCAKKPDAPVAGGDPAPAPVASDPERAQGTWKLVKVEWPEAAGRDAPSQKEIDATLITIKGDRIAITFEGNTEDLSHAFFKGDATKSPRQVDFVSTDGPNSREPRKHKVHGVKDGKPVVVSEFTQPPLQAIYKFEGDELVIAFPFDPDAGRPTEFKPGMAKRSNPMNGETPVLVLHLKKK